MAGRCRSRRGADFEDGRLERLEVRGDPFEDRRMHSGALDDQHELDERVFDALGVDGERRVVPDVGHVRTADGAAERRVAAEGGDDRTVGWVRSR